MKHFSEMWMSFVGFPVIVPITLWLIYLRIQGARALNISFWKMQIIRPPKDKERLVRISGMVMLTVTIVAVSLDLLARYS
jgi:hypothetical protein